jgi:hypothetical protein
MPDYYTPVHTETRDGFKVTLLVTPEYEDPEHHFDDPETVEAINSGKYEWFIARVVVEYDDVELGDDYLGACCYENYRDFIRDGYYDDMVDNAMSEARERLVRLARFAESHQRAQRTKD